MSELLVGLGAGVARDPRCGRCGVSRRRQWVDREIGARAEFNDGDERSDEGQLKTGCVRSSCGRRMTLRDGCLPPCRLINARSGIDFLEQAGTFWCNWLLDSLPAYHG